MIKNKTITVCMPCRNEGSHLVDVVKEIPEYVDEIIIVSNKSTDDTVEIAKHLRVRVIEDDRTLNGIGYGFAYQTGILAATGDYVVCLDADGTYPSEKIGEMVEYMEAHNVDFISGTRYPVDANTNKIPFKLKLGVFVLNWEVFFLYGIRIHDTLSGMWVFKRSIIPQLDIKPGHWIGDWNESPQIKINAARNPNVKFEEYHITQRVRMGQTKQNYFKTGFGHLFWIFLYRFGINRATKMDVIATPLDLHTGK
jgi:glycosyltransferase involved in cell wall biosynthesis